MEPHEDETHLQGMRRRLEPLIERFYVDGPGSTELGLRLIYLRQLERAVQEEVDRELVRLREDFGFSFPQIAGLAAGRGGTPESAQMWRTRYGHAVKRLRGPNEEVLGIRALRKRREEIKKFEAVMEVGPRPEVKRSRDTAPRFSVPARQLQRGDLIGLVDPRVVVSAKTHIEKDGSSYVDVVLHDATSRCYGGNEQVSFGYEDELKG